MHKVDSPTEDGAKGGAGAVEDSDPSCERREEVETRHHVVKEESTYLLVKR